MKYEAAERHLEQAMRKAPQNSAIGFKQTVTIIPPLTLVDKTPPENTYGR